MPNPKSSKSGYARIVQAEEEAEEYVDNDVEEDEDQRVLSRLSTSDTDYAPIQPGRHQRMQSHQTTRSNGTFYESKSGHRHRRQRSTSAVDIKAINARLEKWADEIASKFKLRKVKGKSLDEEKLEIHYSVFQAPDDIRPATTEVLLEHYREEAETRMTKVQFDDVIESVRVAIELNVQPKMILKGSSGSYFARNSDETVVGVFKPKDEEPYAAKNPKLIKWLHRNLFPFAFGRAMLIPNLSYVSEAAAYVLDTRLHTNIVPYTDVVYLSSPSFNYDYWDRRAYYRKKKPLPPKPGSFQVFLKGYQDATQFLKKHPWPEQSRSVLRTDTERRKHARRWGDECRKGGSESEDEEEAEHLVSGRTQSQRRGFWTDSLQQSFREELEKLVILDYIMRNTDRGLDNWMIRIDEETQQATIVADVPRKLSGLLLDENDATEPYKREEQMSTRGSNTPSPPTAKVRLGAIDNSLSWPWKHPDAWRSYPFGWLFLPVSLIGQPFSERSRQHFLPLLTSKQWWSETQLALRKCFMQDADFQEKMFARQMAVMKGQAWNVVETLKTHDHGPLELTRRTRVYVWDDLVDIPIAQPLRQSSDEMRRALGIHESDNKHNHGADSVDLVQASHSVPNGHVVVPNRFNSPRKMSPNAAGRDSEEGDIALHPSASNPAGTDYFSSTPKPSKQMRPSRPSTRSSRSRLSYDEPRPTRTYDHSWRKRGHSFTTQRIIDVLEEDDGGDLGFAAAQDQEGNRKKMIVERLETVKSKAPFFTWC